VTLPYTSECAAPVNAAAAAVFDYADDPARFGSHMQDRSWRMGGGRMDFELDQSLGQAVGSVIRLSGRIFGLRLFLEASIVERSPPHRKVWETVSEPRLLVIGRYRMGFEVTAIGDAALLRVFINYALPVHGVGRVLGSLLGRYYAQWCVQRMLNDTLRHFQSAGAATQKESCCVTRTS